MATTQIPVLVGSAFAGSASLGSTCVDPAAPASPAECAATPVSGQGSARRVRSTCCRALAAFLSLLLLGACSSTQTFDTQAAPAQGTAVIVPDNSRHRTWESPLEPSMVSAQVRLRIGNQTLGGFSDRYTVLPGRHELIVSLRDRDTPVTSRELVTDPVVFPVTVQGGREYRVRGGVIYPPASSPHTRTLDTRYYRVIFALQDMSTGQIVSRVQVPHSHINLEG